MIEIVSATRLSKANFFKESALGASLLRLKHDKRFFVNLTFENSRGLPEIYNARISAEGGSDILVFIHDDVWIDDYFLADRVIDGLKKFDVLGVVGSRRRLKNQRAWAFIDEDFTWDSKSNLSGSIAHGKQSFGKVSIYGQSPANCELLDGVFLAARKSTLNAKGVLFDPRFEFHFYDMDFCRSAREKGLQLGTWPICLTHQSGGAFNSVSWKDKCGSYMEKWGE